MANYYYIWSKERDMFWRASCYGYCSIDSAGIFSEKEAIDIVQKSNGKWGIEEVAVHTETKQLFIVENGKFVPLQKQNKMHLTIGAHF